jgi:hypothetical protein
LSLWDDTLDHVQRVHTYRHAMKSAFFFSLFDFLMSSRFGAPRFPPFFSWLKNPFRRQWSSFLIIFGPTVPQLNDHLRFANSHSF